MNDKQRRTLDKLDKEAKQARREQFYDKEKDKAALEKTMADIAETAKREGIK